MKNTKTIRAKILSGFIIVIVLALLLGIFGMIINNIIAGNVVEIYGMHVKGIEALMDAAMANARMRVHLNRMAFYADQGDAAQVNEEKQNFNNAIADFETALVEYSATIVTEAGQREFDRQIEIKAEYLRVLNEFETVLGEEFNNERDEERGQRISGALNKMSAAAAPVNSWLETMQSQKEGAAFASYESAGNTAFVSMIIQIASLVFVIIISVVTSVNISNGTEKTLRGIINKLKKSSGNINASATQLSEASDSLASGASKQAAAIEQTSATMNETSSMVAQNAENTKVAAQIAANVTKSVTESEKYMAELMETMTELKESSDKVSRIIKTIDDIAFQTNLLAINATVEAARAGGDAGRSFAVVAHEVRTLAQRSADASKETADIIEKNMALTDANRSDAEKILSIARKNAQETVDLGKLISEISAASEEQAAGIKQINIAVSQMEKVTQENAAVAEETSASAGTMKTEGGNLEGLVAEAMKMIVKN